MDPSEGTKDHQGHTVSQLLVWLRAIGRWAAQSAGTAHARRLLVASFITLSLAILAWSVHKSWDTLAEFDWQFKLGYLGISFLFYTVAVSLSMLTWAVIMGHLAGYTNLRMSLKIYLYSAAAKRLPGFFWYVGSRLYLYHQEDVPRSLTSVGILLESAFLILSGLLVFLGLMPFSQLDLLAGRSRWLFLGMVPLLVVAFKPTILIRLINASLLRLGRPSLDLHIARRDSLQWVAQYAANWFAGGLTLYFLAWAIHPLPTSALPGMIGIVALTGVLRLVTFFIPGGWGVQELSLSLALSPYLPLPIALGIPVLFRLWLIISELVWVVACSLVL